MYFALEKAFAGGGQNVVLGTALSDNEQHWNLVCPNSLQSNKGLNMRTNNTLHEHDSNADAHLPCLWAARWQERPAVASCQCGLQVLTSCCR